MCRLMSTTAAVQWFLEWQNPVILIIVLLHALTLRNFRVILKSAAMAVAQDCYLTATCSCSFSSCTTRYYVSDLPLDMIIWTSGLSLGKVLAVLMQCCASSHCNFRWLRHKRHNLYWPFKVMWMRLCIYFAMQRHTDSSTWFGAQCNHTPHLLSEKWRQTIFCTRTVSQSCTSFWFY